MRRTLVGLFVFCLLLGAAACGDDDDGGRGGDLGSACIDDRDCRERCVRGGDWPGGMCTYGCFDDYDCPSGTACVDRDGGVCAVTCGSHSDCAGFGFSSGYACRSTHRHGAGGDVLVCRGD